jgi:hypothetical protein
MKTLVLRRRAKNNGVCTSESDLAWAAGLFEGEGSALTLSDAVLLGPLE